MGLEARLRNSVHAYITKKSSPKDKTEDMSASPMARAVSGVGIPTRRVIINSESEMPTNYGTTPGGTMFAHTPGGTRIVYERAFLMQMRQSPLAKTPPANLPVIPGVTVPASTSPNKNCASSPKKTNDSSGDAERRTSSMDCPSKLQSVPEASPADEEDQFGIEV